MNLKPPPLSLYVHIPWCVRKCPYCDFNSHTAPEALPAQAYTDALLNDLAAERRRSAGRSLCSVFIGGGTPSLFPARVLGRLLDGIAAGIPCQRGAEVSLEANPGTAEQRRFADFRAAGVNRLSIGVQSFDDRKLQELGRIHDGSEALRAVRAARAAGFDNINIDLMHGLPEQTPEQALDDLHQAIALEPTQISWYQLSIEKNTAFYSRPPELPGESTLTQIQEQGEQLLTDAGYRQYEVSAWSLPDRECQHNLNYWRFGDYLGIGAGAHGKCSEIYIKINKCNENIQYDAKSSYNEKYVNDVEKDSNDDKCIDMSSNEPFLYSKRNTPAQNHDNLTKYRLYADKCSHQDGKSVSRESPGKAQKNTGMQQTAYAQIRGRRRGIHQGINIVRTEKKRLPQSYMECFGKGKAARGGVREWTVSEAERPLEFMMNALRLKQGCRTTLFEMRTGLTLPGILPILRRLQNDGLLEKEKEQIRLTTLGYRFLDEVLQAFAPEQENTRAAYIICAQPGARSSVG